MSFKRPAPQHYGYHKRQKIINNGVEQQTPFDRKSGPLDQQKKVVLVLSSDDRDLSQADQQPESSASDLNINLQLPIKGVYGYRVSEMSFTNRFFSVQKDLNDTLTVTWTGDTKITPTDKRTEDLKAGIIRLDEGFYEFSSDPADHEFRNPLFEQVPNNVPNLNDIDRTADDTMWNLIKDAYPLDIRVELMRAAYPLIGRIQTDRKTDRIKITWGSAFPSVTTGLQATLIPTLSTALSVLGLPRVLKESTWQGIAAPNVDGPANFAMQSSVLNNSELVDPKGENDTFLLVPVQVAEGERQLYAPFNPQFVNINGSTGLNRIPIKIVEPQSGKVLKSNNMEWTLTLELYTYEGALS